jgi:hypothetical protein
MQRLPHTIATADIAFDGRLEFVIAAYTSRRLASR